MFQNGLHVKGRGGDPWAGRSVSAVLVQSADHLSVLIASWIISSRLSDTSIVSITRSTKA